MDIYCVVCDSSPICKKCSHVSAHDYTLDDNLKSQWIMSYLYSLICFSRHDENNHGVHRKLVENIGLPTAKVYIENWMKTLDCLLPWCR